MPASGLAPGGRLMFCPCACQETSSPPIAAQRSVQTTAQPAVQPSARPAVQPAARPAMQPAVQRTDTLAVATTPQVETEQPAASTTSPGEPASAAATDVEDSETESREPPLVDTDAASSRDPRRCQAALDASGTAPGAAIGASPPGETAAPRDSITAISVQPLFLRAEESLRLETDAVARFRNDLHLEDRYQLTEGSLDSRDPCRRLATLNAVRDWCRQATVDLQERRGDIDAQRGVANVTVDAINERCGALFEYTLEASNPSACTGDGLCRTVARMVLRKYRVSGFSANGQPNFEADAAFGTAGDRRFEIDLSLPGTPRIANPIRTIEAIPGAVISAGGAALAIARQLQDVRELQVHAPIGGISSGAASFCASRAEVPLDTPFFVRTRRNGVEVDVGLVRARELLDGCTLTTSLRNARTEGRQVRIGPSRAQLILGGSDVVRGMALWQMPSVGLNLTAALGTVTGPTDFRRLQVTDFTVPIGFIGAEYNWGRWVGASELYVVANVGFGTGIFDPANRTYLISMDQTQFSTMVSTDYLFLVPNLRAELGILKRLYFGRGFFQAAALGYFGRSFLGDITIPDASFVVESVGSIPGVFRATVNYFNTSFGGIATVGLGWAVSPRVLFRFDAGAQIGVSRPESGITTGRARLQSTGPSLDIGPTVRMGLSYEL
jgi:hypothetical protein